MRMSLKVLSDADIEHAHVVTAIDPNAPIYSQQLYGQESVPSMLPPGAPARVVNVLDIEIDSSDDAQLQDLMSKVETVKGHLPQVVQRLRKPK